MFREGSLGFPRVPECSGNVQGRFLRVPECSGNVQ